MATDEKAQSVSAEEFFKSCDYTGSDFRKESHLYRQFYYDEIYTAPGLSWCTEYYYRRMPDGRYRFVIQLPRRGEPFGERKGNEDPLHGADRRQ